MDKDHHPKIARLIAQEVMTGHGRTPAERVLRQHSQSISEWRELGWTWGQIAALLTKGGLRLKDGTAVTERYLAAVFSRIRTKTKSSPQGKTPAQNTLPHSSIHPVTRTQTPVTTHLASLPNPPALDKSIGRDRGAIRSRMRASRMARD